MLYYIVARHERLNWEWDQCWMNHQLTVEVAVKRKENPVGYVWRCVSRYLDSTICNEICSTTPLRFSIVLVPDCFNHWVESTRLTSANPGRSFCISSWVLCQWVMGSIVTCLNRWPQPLCRLQFGQLSAIQLVSIPEYQGEVSLCHIASGFLLQALDACIN
jgi:hypothetical protein